MTRLEMDRAERIYIGAVLPTGLLLMLIAPLVIVARLPNPMAVRFQAESATTSMPVALYLALVGMVIVGCAVVLVASAWRSSFKQGIEDPISAFLGW
jgi:uncharacterized integral membrane protein